MARNRLCFWGRVQGVGFRYTAFHLAQSLGLTGWVQNQRDGSVLMEVQGRSETIQRMIDGLERGTFIQIERMEKQEIPHDDYERRFKIKE